jgi:hypothetical protein
MSGTRSTETGRFPTLTSVTDPGERELLSWRVPQVRRKSTSSTGAALAGARRTMFVAPA